MTNVPPSFTLSVVYMTADAMPSYGQRPIWTPNKSTFRE